MRASVRRLERLLFAPSADRPFERRLGWLLLALVLLGAWLIFWPFIPPLVARLLAGAIDLLGALWSALASIPWGDLLPRSRP